MTAAGARGSLGLLAGSQAMLFAVTSTLVAVNGLAGLAGRWSEDELREFERAVAPFEEVDPELWR